MIELEPHDFDTAITILHTFNKKAKVKEYTIFKEEFIEGNASSYEIDPPRFVEDLKEAACGRSDKYTQKRIRSKVDQSFPLSDLSEIQNLLGYHVFNPMSHLKYAEEVRKEIAYHTWNYKNQGPESQGWYLHDKSGMLIATIC